MKDDFSKSTAPMSGQQKKKHEPAHAFCGRTCVDTNSDCFAFCKEKSIRLACRQVWKHIIRSKSLVCLEGSVSMKIDVEKAMNISCVNMHITSVWLYASKHTTCQQHGTVTDKKSSTNRKSSRLLRSVMAQPYTLKQFGTLSDRKIPSDAFHTVHSGTGSHTQACQAFGTQEAIWDCESNTCSWVPSDTKILNQIAKGCSMGKLPV